MALIDDLEKEGFDTSQITPDLISQLHNEGYDVSGLQRKETAPLAQAKPAWMDEEGLQDVSLTPVTGKDIDKAGVDAAESIGAKGYPKTGAAVGTAIQMAPDIALTAATMGTGGAATEGTQLGRIISGPGRAAAGEAIGAAEKGAGIAQTLPELKPLAQTLNIKNATPRQYVQRLYELVTNGGIDRIPVQRLAEHEEQLGRLLDKEPQGFLGQMLNSDKSQLGKKGVAVASKTRQAISNAINDQIPERADALANYGAAKTREKLYKGAGAAAATALIGGKARKVLSTLFSGGK